VQDQVAELMGCIESTALAHGWMLQLGRLSSSLRHALGLDDHLY
jgi:hypothetical protein